jgi:TolB-like protein/DNA-binding winged helix-turn-helix (wHTH) protein/Tfp pilus assembly protein PilF
VKDLASSGNVVRFGAFELNLKSGEARKHGIRVKLPGQPFQILVMLVSRPGEVVTQEQIRNRLWPNGTFVEFEDSVHTAIKKLRQALGDSADHPTYIETLPRIGYRFIAPVDRPSAAEAVPSQPEADAISGSPRYVSVAKQPLRRGAIILLVTVLGLVAASGVYFQWFRNRVQAQRPVHRFTLAVLPFENLTGNASQEFFSDGLTEEMISQLSRTDPQRFGVIGRTSVMYYKNNPKPLDQIGRELGAEYVLEGSVRDDSARVRIAAQLVRTRDQTNLWSRQYDRDLKDLLSLQAEIAQEVADEVELTLGENRARVASRLPAPTPVSNDAYNLYLQGRYFWNERTASGLRQAAECFQEAVDKDPNYARAYAGLADADALLSTWNYAPASEYMPKARAAALKALQIDESLPEAHTTLALIAEHYDYDWQAAEKEFRRAIQLDPGYATAHQWYAECLSFQGRFAEALEESERARQLDPLSLIIATDHAVILLYSRQYDRAIEQFQAVREMAPDFPRSNLIFFAYVASGRFAEALALLEGLARRNHFENSPGEFASEALIYGRWGKRAEALHAFARFERQSKDVPVIHGDEDWTPLSALLGVGRNEDAVALLQRAYEEHANLLLEVKVHPLFDPLRGDPHFQDLLRRVGLAQ